MPDDEKGPLEDPLAEASGRTLGGGVADAVRKVVMTGLGAVFLTEEGARKLARDWKLPKEIVGYVTAQATGAKDEIVRVISDEVKKFFESPALRREFLRALSSMSIEINAEVRLKPAKGGHVEPEVKVSSVRPRVRRKDEADEE